MNLSKICIITDPLLDLSQLQGLIFNEILPFNHPFNTKFNLAQFKTLTSLSLACQIGEFLRSDIISEFFMDLVTVEEDMTKNQRIYRGIVWSSYLAFTLFLDFLSAKIYTDFLTKIVKREKFSFKICISSIRSEKYFLEFFMFGLLGLVGNLVVLPIKNHILTQNSNFFLKRKNFQKIPL